MVHQMISDISIDRVRFLLNYDKNSGVFRWNVDRYARKVKGSVAGWVSKTKGHKTSYVNLRIDGVVCKAHRIAWLMHYGEWPEYIDHIDGDGTNNRISNLRSVSMSENMKNKPLQENNTSGVSGVTYIKSRKKWLARISNNGERVVIGVFDEFNDAAQARRRAEFALKYHRNHGRKQ